jgi:hypothetical protein
MTGTQSGKRATTTGITAAVKDDAEDAVADGERDDGVAGNDEEDARGAFGDFVVREKGNRERRRKGGSTETGNEALQRESIHTIPVARSVT